MLLELGAAEDDMVTGLSANTGAVDVAVDVEILKTRKKNLEFSVVAKEVQ